MVVNILIATDERGDKAVEFNNKLLVKALLHFNGRACLNALSKTKIKIIDVHDVSAVD